MINASPDLREQIYATPALHPREGTRGSPIAAVVLTGAEIDQVAGLLSLREGSPFALLRDGGDARSAERQSDIRRASRPDRTARNRGRRALHALPGDIEGELVSGAGQGAALSRRRKSRPDTMSAKAMSA